MIQSNELRYGNKLLFLGNIETFEFIDQIREDGIFWIQTKEQKISHKNFQFKPIELTEDILLKCGFSRNGDWGVLNIPTRAMIRFYNFNCAECDLVQYDKYYAFKCGHIKYLHQLQNLYFALTNQELTINL